MKRVIHLITTIERGGAEKQLVVLAREQVKSGRDVTVIPLKGNLELLADFEGAGVFVDPTLLELPVFKQFLKLKKILRCSHSIVHAHLPRAELLVALACGGERFFASRHNAEPFFPGAPAWLSRFFARLVARRANALIAISHAVSSYILEKSEITPNVQLEVIHYAFDPNSPKFKRKLFDTKKFSDKNAKLVLGTIGRLVPQKDYPTLLNAFELFKKTFPNSELHILGAGRQKKELEDLTIRLGISDSVFFEGKKSNVEDFLIHLDLFVLTSIYEGFGLVLLEAMNLEIPIVASNNSAIPEVLGLMHPGLAETGNALDFCKKITALTSASNREKAIKIQNQSLSNFTPAKLIERMDEVYTKLC